MEQRFGKPYLWLLGDTGAFDILGHATGEAALAGGELLGFGSANPRTEELFLTGSYTTYYGRALAVVRAGAAGKVEITAMGKKYGKQRAEIEILNVIYRKTC